MDLVVFKKRALLALFIAIILLTSAVFVKAETIGMSCGSNYTFNYYNAANESSQQNFTCSGTSCTNTTVYVSNVSVQLLNLSLSPGDTSRQNTTQCDFSASCSSCTNDTSSASCSITRALSSGEFYTNNNAACDLEFSCPTCSCNETDDDDDLCVAHEDVTFDKKVRIYNDGGKLKFILDGQEQIFLMNGTFDYSAEFSYTCPADLRVNASTVTDELISLCEQVNPYLVGWVDEAIDRGYNCQEQIVECVAEKYSLSRNCEDEVLGLKEAVAIAETNVNGTMASYQRCLDDKSEMGSSMGLWQALAVITSLLSGMLIIGCIIMGVALWKSKQDNTPGVQGRGGM